MNDVAFLVVCYYIMIIFVCMITESIWPLVLGLLFHPSIKID